MNPDNYRIIRRPLRTEKTETERESHNVLTFEVDPHANKIEVRRAVEALFKVKVAEVRLFNVRGKRHRAGRSFSKDADWRKAYVRLKEGEKAPDFAGGI